MNKFLLFLLAGLFSSTSYATCHGSATIYGPDMLIDLSDKLSEKNKVFTQTTTSDFGSSSFNCTTDGSVFKYLAPPKERSVDIGFNNGKYWVRTEIVDSIGDKTLSSGPHSAGELNTPVTLRFSLIGSGPDSGKVSGDTGQINTVIIAKDTSGMSFLEIVAIIPKFLYNLGAWVLSGFKYWPLEQRDMFTQNLNITYTPKMTTCSFNNAGLMVNLPKIGLAQLTKSPQPGYTPFILNFTCNNILSNGSTDRAIDMFLSSNSLLSSDNSVLIDSTSGSAKGVGIKVAKRETPNTPIVFSTSTLNRGSGTSIFNAAAGAALESNFSIGMGAYYFPYSPAELTSGNIRTTATLSIIYQ